MSLASALVPASAVLAVADDGTDAGNALVVADNAVRYGGSAIPCKSGVIIRNMGPNTVYWGGVNVTDLLGMPLKINETFNPGEAVQDLQLIYFICAAAETGTLRCVVIRP